MSRPVSPKTVVSSDDDYSAVCVRRTQLNLQPQDDGAAPQSFICPLTLNVMMDPVMDFDGNTYERSAIVEWLATKGTSPVTRNPLSKDHLVPNRALRELIHAHMGPEWCDVAEKQLRPIPKEHQPPMPSPASTAANSNTGEFRATIDSFLEQISRAVGKNIRLNDQGISAFTYEHLTIVIEVPETVGSFFIYSEMEFDQGKRLEMLQKAMELNYLQQETRGGCLSCEKTNGDLFFSYTDRIAEINATDFRNILENFIDTAITLSATFKAL